MASMFLETEKVKEDEYDYDGYKEVYLDEDEMNEFYSNPDKNIYDLYINQYLLIYNKETGECVDRVCWTGEEYRHLSYGNFSSQGNVEAQSFTKDGTNLDDIYASKSDTYTKTETDTLLNAKFLIVFA